MRTYNIQILFGVFQFTSLHIVSGMLSELEKIKMCESLICDENEPVPVCGIKKQNGTNVYRLFDNECVLLKYGCQVKGDDETYGIINMENCINLKDFDEEISKCKAECDLKAQEPVCGIRKNGEGYSVKLFKNICQLTKTNCEQRLEFIVTDNYLCDGPKIDKLLLKRRNLDRKEGENIDLLNGDENNSTNKQTEETENSVSSNEDSNSTEVKHNTANTSKQADETTIQEENTTEASTEDVTMQGAITSETTDRETSIETKNTETYTLNNEEISDLKFTTTLFKPITKTASQKNQVKHKNVIIVKGSRSDLQNINTTAEKLFAHTHAFGLPIQEIPEDQQNLTTRRKILIKIFGPVKVFSPKIEMPKVEDRLDDYEHKPTLMTCFHKCPKVCPEVYNPVCGVPGIRALEPSIMFLNHCYMDMAQCKMRYEDKSATAHSSNYVESIFIFCLGEEMNSLYRFLPLIRTLQHMGRLKRKGKFKYEFKNMRYPNIAYGKNAKIMG